MAESTHKGKAPNEILGLVLCIITPASVVILLGIFGINLIGTQLSFKAPPAEEEPEATAVAAAAPAASAPATPAPAADASAAETPAPEASAAETVSYTPEEQALIDQGPGLFAQYCNACHGPEANAVIKMAPQFAESKVLVGPNSAPVLAVLNGIQKLDQNFMGLMAPLGPVLTDEQIAAIISYLRTSNGAAPVTPKMVAAAREIAKAHQQPYTRAELEAMTDELPSE